MNKIYHSYSHTSRIRNRVLDEQREQRGSVANLPFWVARATWEVFKTSEWPCNFCSFVKGYVDTFLTFCTFLYFLTFWTFATYDNIFFVHPCRHGMCTKRQWIWQNASGFRIPRIEEPRLPDGKIWSLPFLGVRPHTLAQSKVRKGSNFEAQRSGAIVQKPEGPNTYNLKIWL